MEIIKQNENFNLVDTTEKYDTNGNVSREASGALNIHFTVMGKDGERVGDCHYNRYGDEGAVNFGVSCVEDVREELTTYSDSVIDSVLEYFKVNN